MKHIKLLLILLLCPFVLLAQKTLEGTVTDTNNMPLPGASIIIKGTTKGAVTNFDGKFNIEIDKSLATIVVSYLGYITKEVVITNQKTVAVVLEANQQELNEVVVIGYGSVNKKDLTGAVTSIKPTQEVAEQSSNIQDIIRGRAAGVQVSSNGSEPGSSMSIKIRGTSSLTANSEPLYVVDGIIMDTAAEDVNNPLSGYSAPQGGGVSGVNPEDIESIEVLKDASATAIYGSRAANGVIIITTKKGKKGKAKFNFTSSLTTGSVVRNIDVLDVEGYANYQNDMKAALGQEPAFDINSNGEIYYSGTTDRVQGINWAKDTYQNSMIKKNRISASGGGDNGSYYISGGMISNKGTIPNALAKSVDFNLNLNQDLTDRVKINTKIATTYTDLSSSKGTDENGGINGGMVRQVLLAAPIVNFADNNPDPSSTDEAVDGPRAWTTDYDDKGKEVRLLGSLTMDYKLSKALTYRFRFGGDYRRKERSFWYGTALLKGRDPNGLAGISTLNRFRYNVDNTLMYRKSFNKNNRINATIGALIDKTSLKTSRYSAANFADKSLRADGISYGSTYTPLIIDSEFPTIISFIGRLNYTLYNRYLFTGTFRADGSSKFAKGNQWGYFPAFSFAWKATEEPFLKKQKLFSDLKVRLGYGEVGNQNIPPYSYLTPFGATEAALSDASGGSLVAVVPLNLANPDLKWETAIQYNAGIDFGLFKDRLSGTVDVYKKTSSDLLLKVALGPTAGFDYIIANQGDLENKGLEISLNADIIKNENFNWNLFGNISFNKNKITNLGQVQPTTFGTLGEQVGFFGNNVSGGTYFKQPANIFIQGKEAGLFYGYETKGIIRTDAELTDTPTGDPLKYGVSDLRVGDVYFVDQNGDGVINDDDKTIIGNPNPDFTFGFGTSFDFKGFSLSAMFNGVYGNNIAVGNFLESGYANNSTRNVLSAAYYDAFDAVNNPTGNYPNVGVGGYGANYTTDFNDRMVANGSFLRLSYVSLAYSIPVKDTKFFDSMKVTLSGQNLWLLTDYPGFDPEVNSFAYDPLRIGIDWGSFPNQRTFTVGLNVTF
jgi:TonB-linked SusC/RagA family outer membrane protein